jgi:hypothetical protein
MAGDESNDIEADWARWLTPRQTVDLLGKIWSGFNAFDVIRTELRSRLREGLIRAAAQTYIKKRFGAETDRSAYTEILPAFWPLSPHSLGAQFWNAGQFTVLEHPHEWNLFGIRFDPDDIAALITEQGFEAVTAEQSEPGKPQRVRDLAESEVSAFCRAIVAGWPDASQDWAHEKALLFYPEHKVPRDWFRSIFRAIQGPKNPGKRPKMSSSSE